MDRRNLIPAILAILSIIFAVIAYRTYMQPTQFLTTSEGLKGVSAFEYLKLMGAGKDNILGGEIFYAEAKTEANRVIKKTLPYAGVSIVFAIAAFWVFAKAKRREKIQEL